MATATKQTSKAKAKGKSKAAPKPDPKGNGRWKGIDFSFSDILAHEKDRDELAKLVKKVWGKDPHPEHPAETLAVYLRYFLDGVDKGMTQEAAKDHAMKAGADFLKKKKATAKAAPTPPAKAEKGTSKGTSKGTPEPKPEPKPVAAAPAVDPPGANIRVDEWPLDGYTEILVEELLKPFRFFFDSLTENEKKKQADAVLQKAWDRKYNGYKVAEVRDAFNSRITRTELPSIVPMVKPFKSFNK